MNVIACSEADPDKINARYSLCASLKLTSRAIISISRFPGGEKEKRPTRAAADAAERKIVLALACTNDASPCERSIWRFVRGSRLVLPPLKAFRCHLLRKCGRVRKGASCETRPIDSCRNNQGGIASFLQREVVFPSDGHSAARQPRMHHRAPHCAVIIIPASDGTDTLAAPSYRVPYTSRYLPQVIVGHTAR